jgi:hypothetical protein
MIATKKSWLYMPGQRDIGKDIFPKQWSRRPKLVTTKKVVVKEVFRTL